MNEKDIKYQNIFDEILKEKHILEDEIKILKEVVKPLTIENYNLADYNKQLKKENNYLRTDISKILKEKHTFEDEIKILNEENKYLRNELNKKIKKYNKLSEENKELQKLKKENQILLEVNDYLAFKYHNPNAKYDMKSRKNIIKDIRGFINAYSYKYYVTEF